MVIVLYWLFDAKPGTFSPEDHKTSQVQRMNGPKGHSCLWQMCDGKDEWSHLVTNSCPFYSSKYIPTGDEVLDVYTEIKLGKNKSFQNPASYLCSSKLSYPKIVLPYCILRSTRGRSHITP